MSENKTNTNFVVMLDGVALDRAQIEQVEAELKTVMLAALGRIHTRGTLKAAPLPAARSINWGDGGGGMGGGIGGGGHTAGMRISE